MGKVIRKVTAEPTVSILNSFVGDKFTKTAWLRDDAKKCPDTDPPNAH